MVEDECAADVKGRLPFDQLDRLFNLVSVRCLEETEDIREREQPPGPLRQKHDALQSALADLQTTLRHYLSSCFNSSS